MQSLALGIADDARRLDRGPMLAHEPRLRPLGADILDPDGLAGDDRERARIVHDLPATFVFRSVDDDHMSTNSRKSCSA